MMPDPTSIHIEQVINRNWPWSAWLTLLAAVAVVSLVAALYWTEQGRATRLMRLGLMALRIAVLGLVVWMLAGWSIDRYKTDLPELVVLLDDSASMQTVDLASTTARNSTNRSRWDSARQLAQQLGSAADAQRNSYRPKLLLVADSARQLTTTDGSFQSPLKSLTADGQTSRLGDCLIEVLQRQSGRPMCAVVLLSDGIVTSGARLDEAVALARRLNVPIYCVATGEQLPQPDLALQDLLVDDAVYLGDQVNVQVTVVASDIAAHRATINLRDMQSGQIVDTAQVELTTAKNSVTTQLSYVPKLAGQSTIKVEVITAPGEKNLENNSLQRVIEVRDQTLNILLIQRSPSFEYRFLKVLLERTSHLSDPAKKAFRLDVVLQDADAAHVAQDTNALRLVPGDQASLAQYDVIIVGQVDPALIASSTQQLIVDQVSSAGCGVLFVCHPDFEPHQLVSWPIGKLLPMDFSASSSQLAARRWFFQGQAKRWQPTVLGQAALPLQLTDAASFESLWQGLPGPEWYLNPGPLKPAAQVLASSSSLGRPLPTANGNSSVQSHQEAPSNGSVEDAPLLISQFYGAGRVVMQTNDETYRWIGYQGNELMYDRYWIQMIRWLSRGKLNRQGDAELDVQPRRAQFGQAIQISARLSTGAIAQLQSGNCRVLLESSTGENQAVELKRSATTTAEYRAFNSSLAPGSYRAVLVEPSMSSQNSVAFTVTAPPGEQANLRSDWSGLKTLAEQTHGRFYTLNDAHTLVSQLPKGTPVRRGSLPPIPLWNTPWVAIALVVLLAAEWIVRRAGNML